MRALSMYKRTKVESSFNIDKAMQLNTLLVNRSMSRMFWFGLFFYFVYFSLWKNSYLLASGLLISTPSIVLLQCILLGLGILVFNLNKVYFRVERVVAFEYPVLLAFTVLLLMLLLMSFDLFLMFILFEFVTMLFIILIGGVSSFSRNTLYAAFFYFLSNVIVGGVFLFTLFLGIFGGMTTLFPVAVPEVSHFLVIVCLLGILVLFLFKLSCFPFQWWTPFVYERAPLPILFILATGSKLVACFLLFKVLHLVFLDYSAIGCSLLLLSGLFSMIIGSFGLLLQTNLKKFWGYSTINHMGFLLLGMSSGNLLGWRGFCIYLVGYLLLNIIFFYLLNSLIKCRTNTRLTTIAELALIPNFRYSLFGWCFGLLMLASIGLPPFVTFWGKYMLISAYILSESTSLVYLVLFIILVTSVVSAYAYLRVWKTIYAEDVEDSKKIMIYAISLDSLNVVFFYTGVQTWLGLSSGMFISKFSVSLDHILFMCFFC